MGILNELFLYNRKTDSLQQKNIHSQHYIIVLFIYIRYNSMKRLDVTQGVMKCGLPYVMMKKR